MANPTKSCFYSIISVTTILCYFCSVEARSLLSMCNGINATISIKRVTLERADVVDAVADLFEQVKVIRQELLSTNWNESTTDPSRNRNQTLVGGDDPMLSKELSACLTHPDGKTLIEIIKCLNQFDKKAVSNTIEQREAPSKPAKQDHYPQIVTTDKPKNQIDPERQRIKKVFLSLNGL